MRGGSPAGAVRLAVRRLSVAILAAYLVLAPGGAHLALGAPPDLQVVSTATYEVRPDDRAVHVEVQGTATSYKADTAETTYYFPAMRLVIFAGATNLSATASGTTARVSVINADEHQQLVEVALNRDLYYRQSTTFRLAFDLPSGAAGDEVRVGANVARFPVWAVASAETPGSSVAISLPRGFQLDLQGEPLPDPELRDDGRRIYRWEQIPDPETFWLFATADQATITQDTYRDYTSHVQVPGQQVEIVVRAWADDPDWGSRTSARVSEALPILGDLIGVRYFGTARLLVIETVSRSLNGYAGIFDSSQAEDEIQVAFDADDIVTLHEAAHAWFNNALSSDRWILEGFASHYGAAAAQRLGIEPESFALSDQLRAAAFPLAEWGYPGVESAARELYAYGASLAAAREIADRAGSEGLTLVFSAMAADEAAYQPLAAERPEVSYSHPSNWRYFLDLLEERTGKSYVDVIREWVVSPSDRHLLDGRRHARAAYAHLLSQLDGWAVPGLLRRQMNAWSFASAEATMSSAGDVIDERDALLGRAEDLGLEIPLDDVRGDFEGGGMERAAGTASRIDGSLDAYAAALAASGDEIDAVEWVGLLGADPSVDLARSASALEEGDWDAASAAAGAATMAWQAAAGEGTVRLAVAGGMLLVLTSGAIGVAVVRRSRSRRDEPPEPPEAPEMPAV